MAISVTTAIERGQEAPALAPETERITVLRLDNTAYAEHGVFDCGASANLALFPEFVVSVDDVLDAV